MDGALVSNRTTVAKVNGSARALLTGERTALNFLGPHVGHRDVDAENLWTRSQVPLREYSTLARQLPAYERLTSWL